MVEAIVDSREYSNQPYIISLLSEDLSLVQKELEVGDYLCGRVIFEHKTCENLIQDIYNGHLLQQCQDMAYSSLFGYVPNVIMSCNISDIFKYVGSSLSEDFLLGTISSINYHYGIKTTFLSNERMLVKYMKISFEKGNEVKMPSVSPVRKPVFTGDAVAYHYSTIPSVGKDIAIKLKEVFPLPIMLYSSSIEKLQEVPLIGEKRAKKIYDFVHGI